MRQRRPASLLVFCKVGSKQILIIHVNGVDVRVGGGPGSFPIGLGGRRVVDFLPPDVIPTVTLSLTADVGQVTFGLAVVAGVGFSRLACLTLAGTSSLGTGSRFPGEAADGGNDGSIGDDGFLRGGRADLPDGRALGRLQFRLFRLTSDVGHLLQGGGVRGLGDLLQQG